MTQATLLQLFQNWEIARDGIETMEEMIDKVRDIL